MMIQTAWVGIMILLELCTPKGLAVLAVFANIFIPDMVPLIDEVLGVIITVKRLSSD